MGLHIFQGSYVCPGKFSELWDADVEVELDVGHVLSPPIKSIPGNGFAGVVNGRVVLGLLDQMELLNGIVDHRLPVFPRMDCKDTMNQKSTSLY